jgi:hypothetical protein
LVQNEMLIKLTTDPYVNIPLLCSSLLRYEAEVERASAELAKLSYRDGAFEELEDKHQNLRHEVNAMKQQVSISIIISALVYFRSPWENI